jgi:hypothetical protein
MLVSSLCLAFVATAGHPQCPAGKTLDFELTAPTLSNTPGSSRFISQPAAPLVELRTELGERFLSSQDYPLRAPAVPLGPLYIQAYWPDRNGEFIPPRWLEILLDGQAVQHRAVRLGGSAPADGIQIEAPAPGRHKIEARYLSSEGLWSATSRPIYIDIQKPPRPEVIELFDANGLPILKHYPLVKTDCLRVNLGNISDLQSTIVVAFIDGEATKMAHPVGTFEVPLAHLLPGTYSMNFAVYAMGDDPLYRSDLSRTMQIEYAPRQRAVVLRMPENKPCPSDGSNCAPARSTPEPMQPAKAPLPLGPPTSAPPHANPAEKTEPAPEDSTASSELQPRMVSIDLALQEQLPDGVRKAPPPFDFHRRRNTLMDPRLVPEAQAPGANVACLPTSPQDSPSSLTRAFHVTPLVKELGSEDEQQCECPDDKRCQMKFETSYAFVDPAHFPRREFGLTGQSFAREGLVIYEGMRFRCNPHGQYEVEFMAEAPPVPVNLRLQLAIIHNEGQHSITLPPIRLESSEGRDQIQSASFLVKQQGYSPALVGCSRIDSMKRTGAARFGFNTTIQDEN